MHSDHGQTGSWARCGQVDEKRPTLRFECLTIHMYDMPTNQPSGRARSPDADQIPRSRLRWSCTPRTTIEIRLLYCQFSIIIKLLDP